MRKIRRLSSAALAFALGLTTINLTACDALFGSEENSIEHTHVFDEWTLAQGESSCNGGTFERVCTDCKEKETRTGTANDHVWSTAYAYDNTHHWTVCERCEEANEKAWHADDGANLCSICDCLIPSQAVYYEISADGGYAIVTGYDAMETDVLVVAPTYENLPVTKIDDSAFEGCTRLARITLPDSITTIGENAFNGCKRLLGIYLSNNVTNIGANAFMGCSELTIFAEGNVKETRPSGWDPDWNPDKMHIVPNHSGERATAVSIKANTIADAMLRQEDADRTQILINPDIGDVRAPEGFSSVTRFDGKQTPPGTPWTEGNLWHHNWLQMNLSDYSEVWFAAKLKNAFWAFVHENGKPSTEAWMYIHIKQTGVAENGYLLWSIEMSIGGYVYSKIENQTGRHIDDSRPANSIARLLWDEGFGSPDKNALLIYNNLPYLEEETATLSIYCTEVRGIKKGGLL